MNPIYRIFTLLLVLSLSLGLSSCDDSEFPLNLPNSADQQGNLALFNDSGQELVLYVGSEAFRIIPNSSQQFLVNIPNPENQTLDLVLARLSDVEPLLEDGEKRLTNDSLYFKRWNVPLSDETDREQRHTWVVNAENTELNSGSLEFRYNPGGANPPFVNVHLNSRTGARLLTMSPGQQPKVAGVDYGSYTLHYEYFVSDPNTPQGSERLGWVDTRENANGDEVPITTTLNAATDRAIVQIPRYSGSFQNDETGTIFVENRNANLVQIYANNQLIEEVMDAGGQVTDGLSDLPTNQTRYFNLPVNTYALEAREFFSQNTVADTTITVAEGDTLNWEVR